MNPGITIANTSVSFQGLKPEEVAASRQQHGRNTFDMREERLFRHVLKEVVLEPMFILLVATSIIYFLLQQYHEGFIMLVAIFIVAGISLYQEYRSSNAIQALKKLAAPGAKVLRDGKPVQIVSQEIVVGDILLLEEGGVVPADGLIVAANDFSLNEATLTGESLPVTKTEADNNSVYKGTLVYSGAATVKVNAVGNKTMFAKIGLSLQEIPVVKTALQQQIRSFVRNMVWFGAAAFFVVVGYNFFLYSNVATAFLQGLTLAMSVLPEEIPVAFSTFMALGAFRLLRGNIIVKQPQYVETLGSATVFCVDKTGTLTENKMSIEFIYDAATKRSVHCKNTGILPPTVIEYAMWASETTPFDPMEKAIHHLYETSAPTDRRREFLQVHEYPVGGKPPMMTHVFRNAAGDTIIAAKGAPEAILAQSQLTISELKQVEEHSRSYAKQGYRVLGVGKGIWKEKQYPLSQQEFVFEFLGLMAFHDPPKAAIAQTIRSFLNAGIQVKMVTGDYAETAVSIARQIHLDGNYEVLTGNDVLQLTSAELQQKVKQVNIFARMFPEAKLKVIDALKENGEVVAMTGDGVNDAPALKAAHIGIAMGQRGNEVAKNAASLIITDDDLGHMVDAVALGRKIYDNLKKAIQYIVSIHIPIILIVTLPLVLQWKVTGIFSPVHVIFLELIMGPTCSIIYENEPMEPSTMLLPPRHVSHNFLSANQLILSIIQGLMITVGCLGMGYYCILLQDDQSTVRTVIFITLLFSNIFLTLVNRSFRYPVLTTIRYKNYLVPLIIGITLFFIFSFLYIPFLRQLFGLTILRPGIIVICATIGLISTVWLEVYKLIRSKRMRV